MIHRDGDDWLPDFNFEVQPEKRYSHEIVAEMVLWPTLDHLWRGDWRKDAALGNSFVYPKPGIYAGEYYEVNIMANVDTEDITLHRAEENGDVLAIELEDGTLTDGRAPIQKTYSEEQMILCRRVCLRIERPSDDALVSTFRMALKDDPEAVCFWVGKTKDEIADTDVEEMEIDESLLADDLRVRSVAQYKHDSLGRSSADFFVSLQDQWGGEIWSSQGLSEDEEGDLIEVNNDQAIGLGELDLDNMAIAATILGSHQEVQNNITALKTSVK